MADDTPELVRWRLDSVEEKVNEISSKLDSLRDLVIQTKCPSPGACITVNEGLVRLEKRVDGHSTILNEISTFVTTTKVTSRIITAAAITIGSILGTISGYALDFFSRRN